jgi:hypothetical protein
VFELLWMHIYPRIEKGKRKRERKKNQPSWADSAQLGRAAHPSQPSMAHLQPPATYVLHKLTVALLLLLPSNLVTVSIRLKHEICWKLNGVTIRGIKSPFDCLNLPNPNGAPNANR